MKLNKIHCADCIEFMSGMDSDSVGVVVTSPPYNMNLRIRGDQFVKRSPSEKRKYQNYHDAMPMDDYFRWQRDCIWEMIRVSSGYVFYNTQIVTGNKRALFSLIGEFSDLIKEVIIWDKINSEPAMLSGVLNSQFEMILCFSKHTSISRQFKDCSFERGTMANVIRIGKKTGNKLSGLNSAQFSAELPFVLLKSFAQKSDIVFDPFIGLGATAIASHALGMQWIGCDIDKNTCSQATKVVGDYTNDLFSI